MKLYYSPGACSLSPHIVLRETGTKFDLEQVNNKTKQTRSGADYLKINPKGYVPALEMDDGEVLTEGPAIVQYIADKAGATSLLPEAGSKERYRAIEWLNFITSELHKSFGPLFNADVPEAYKTMVKEKLGQRLDFLEKHFTSNDHLLGKAFSVADAYMFTVLSWTRFVGIDIAKWPAVAGYLGRVAARPAVQAAMQAEGLTK